MNTREKILQLVIALIGGAIGGVLYQLVLS